MSRISGKQVIGAIPVGGILHWHKSFSNVPALPPEFLECNGQTISDLESPFDGQTVPDINGSGGQPRFLRGKTSSGGTGGQDSLTHSHSPSLSLSTSLVSICTGSSASISAVSAVFVASNSICQVTLSTLPSYFEATAIMRIK